MFDGLLSAPRAKQGVSLGWADLHIRVLSQIIGTYSKDQCSSSRHDDNEGIGGGIAQPVILETLLFGKSQKGGTRGRRRFEATLTDRTVSH